MYNYRCISNRMYDYTHNQSTYTIICIYIYIYLDLRFFLLFQEVPLLLQYVLLSRKITFVSFVSFCSMLIHCSSKGGILRLRTKAVFMSSWSNHPCLNWTKTVLTCFERQSQGCKQTPFWISVCLLDFESVWRCLDFFWLTFDYFLADNFYAFWYILIVLQFTLLCADSSGAFNEWPIACENIINQLKLPHRGRKV